MTEPITREKLADIGGLEYKMEVPEALAVAKCKELKTWPDGVPEDFVFYGQKVYKKSAKQCADELGTTPRQISKLRGGRIQEAKPLTWYAENSKPTGS